MSKKDHSPIKSAYFEGGMKAMDAFVRANLVYPTQALAQKIEGTVHLFLDIDQKGNVVKVKIIVGVGYGCDEEAVRLAKLLKFHVEKIRNMHVVHHQKLQIHFKLPQHQDTLNIEPSTPIITIEEEPIHFAYTFVPNATAKPAKVQTKKQHPAKVTYTYTVS